MYGQMYVVLVKVDGWVMERVCVKKVDANVGCLKDSGRGVNPEMRSAVVLL